MAINFPANPSVGDVLKYNNTEYRWSGVKWASRVVVVGIPTDNSQLVNGANYITSSDNITGNADTATSLETARTLSVSGDSSGSVSFDGTGDVDISTTLATVNSDVGSFGSGGSIPTITVNAKGLITGVTTTSVNPANDGILTLATSGNGLSGSASFTANDTDNVTFTVTSNATDTNTSSTIVTRDGSGNFSAGIITATLSGNVTGNATGLSGGPSITVSDIIATGNVSIAGTLTYEDVTNIDSIGIVTARTGVRVLTGTATTALVVEGNARVTGILTVGSSSLTLDGTNNVVNVGTALTLGHTNGIQFHTQNLHSQGFEVNNVNVSGIVTATSFEGDGSNLTGIGLSVISNNNTSVSIASTDGSIVLKSNDVIVASFSSTTAYWRVPLFLDDNKITNLAEPSSSSDATNKDYVDNQIDGVFPTGDYGNLISVTSDSFGQVIGGFTSFDCLTTPTGSLNQEDLGVLT